MHRGDYGTCTPIIMNLLGLGESLYSWVSNSQRYYAVNLTSRGVDLKCIDAFAVLE
jgi:hypothetical protein